MEVTFGFLVSFSPKDRARGFWGVRDWVYWEIHLADPVSFYG